jgi:hypothetical protein
MKYIIKYINKLKIKAILVESKNDWQKNAKAKTFIPHKKNSKYI